MSRDITANFHNGNPRSKEAHKRASSHAENLRIAIYGAAVERGAKGDIAENLYRPLGILDNTGTARCSELKALGMLVRSGRTALTTTGSKADVLVADVHFKGVPKPYRNRRNCNESNESDE